MLAEYVVVPAANVRVIPASIPTAQAAAFTLATLTAYRMVVSRAKVTPGDEVLIRGIGGGVALAALQLCVSIGARVWVTSGSDAKLERASKMGAAVLLNHREVDVAKEVRARTGKAGVSVVIDSVGTDTWARSLGALGRAGRLVTCGGTTGHELAIDVRKLFWNQWSILGSTMGNDAEFDAITTELSAGRLFPVVDSEFPLAEGRAAFARLASGEQFGKVVVHL
jgi:NADPH:quinone reductase-like Zn-dependent oxidoreductase